jgi:hypothetical protein
MSASIRIFARLATRELSEKRFLLSIHVVTSYGYE